mgnify:CR=1 FL=1
MTLLQLNYVLELSYYQSFSKTAQKLNISQPALSLQVGKLEEELEIQIFKRSHSTVELTSEGKIFIAKIRDLIQLSENLKDLSFELQERPEGKLRIGVIPTLSPYWIPYFIDDFSKRYPKIELTLLELKTEEIINAVKNGRIDVGFLSTPIQATGVKFKPLFYEQFFLYVSEKHELYSEETVDLENVDLKEMWYLEEGNCFQNQVNSVCVFAKEPGELQNVVYLSNSIESLCRVVELSGGITFVPELATLSVEASKEDMIKNIKGTPPAREISMVTNKISKSEWLVNLFLEMAMKVIPARMKSKNHGNIIDPLLKF